MVDILERLQSQRTSLGTLWPEPNLHEEAAEKIIQLREELAAVTERMSKLDFERTAAELERDALREENARLREALAPFADAGNFKVFISTASTEEECFVSINVKERDLRRARAAILGKVKDEAACPAPDEAP
jgi:K+/H+ antiporter YhaU regulatory subunit KhtT